MKKNINILKLDFIAMNYTTEIKPQKVIYRYERDKFISNKFKKVGYMYRPISLINA